MDGAFEREWFHDLLYPLDYEEVEDLEHEVLHQRATLIINHAFDYEEYIQRYEDAGIPYGVIHVSDETLGDSCNYLEHNCCCFCIRNYHHPVHSFHRKVITIGLGYKTGFRVAQPNVSQQLSQPPWFQWCFAGNIHTSDRLSAVQAATKDVSPYLLHTTNDGFNSKNGLNTLEYKGMMQMSKFAICPTGQGNLDSFRVYEALEAGCIPVVLAKTHAQPYNPSYWHAIFKVRQSLDLPFVIGNTWQECNTEIKRLLQHPLEFFERRKETQKLWKQQKGAWAATMQELIARL